MKSLIIIFISIISVSCSNVNNYSEYYYKNEAMSLELASKYLNLIDSCNCNFAIRSMTDNRYFISNLNESNIEDAIIVYKNGEGGKFMDDKCNELVESEVFKQFFKTFIASDYSAMVRNKYGVFLRLGFPIKETNSTYYGGIIFIEGMDALLFENEFPYYEKIDSNVYLFDNPIVF